MVKLKINGMECVLERMVNRFGVEFLEISWNEANIHLYPNDVQIVYLPIPEAGDDFYFGMFGFISHDKSVETFENIAIFAELCKIICDGFNKFGNNIDSYEEDLAFMYGYNND